MGEAVEPSLLILAQTASWESRFQVSSSAASVAAAGGRADVGLFFAALEAWINDRWDALDPSPPLDPQGRELRAFPPLSSLIEPARSEGRIRLYACSTSTRLLGLEPGKVQSRVEAIVGWPSFARMMNRVDRVVSF